MLFEVYAKGKKWVVRHVLTQSDVMGPYSGFTKKEQAEAYCKSFENSPFIWHFTDPKDLTVLNDYDAVIAFMHDAYNKVWGDDE